MTTLDQDTDELTAMLAAVQERFRGWRFGVEGEVEMTAEKRLAFTKDGSEWLLVVRQGDQQRALLGASRVDRIMAAGLMETLERSLRKNHEDMQAEVRDAARMLREYMYPTRESPMPCDSEEKTK